MVEMVNSSRASKGGSEGQLSKGGGTWACKSAAWLSSEEKPEEPEGRTILAVLARKERPRPGAALTGCRRNPRYCFRGFCDVGAEQRRRYE